MIHKFIEEKNDSFSTKKLHNILCQTCENACLMKNGLPTNREKIPTGVYDLVEEYRVQMLKVAYSQNVLTALEENNF